MVHKLAAAPAGPCRWLCRRLGGQAVPQAGMAHAGGQAEAAQIAALRGRPRPWGLTEGCLLQSATKKVFPCAGHAALLDASRGAPSLPTGTPAATAQGGLRLTFMADKGMPAAIETMMCSSVRMSLISSSTVPTYWGLTAIMMTCEFFATCRAATQLSQTWRLSTLACPEDLFSRCLPGAE